MEGHNGRCQGEVYVASLSVRGVSYWFKTRRIKYTTFFCSGASLLYLLKNKA
jgi:hypothetical protein